MPNFTLSNTNFRLISQLAGNHVSAAYYNDPAPH